MVDKLVHEYPDEYEHGELTESIKKATLLKFRDIIAETVNEFSRRANFVRIYPAKGSKQYDKFFTACKPLNKILYKTLFSNEILPYSTCKRDDESSVTTTAKDRKMSTTVSSIVKDDSKLE